MKITYLNTRRIRENLQRAVEALARQHPEIQRVLLFGSLATGRAAPGSDIDLLVILKSSDHAFLDRIPIYTPEGCAAGVDVFPYTQAEIEWMLAEGNWLIERAIADGLEIFPAAAMD